jgi:hypothetical protein
MFEMPMGPGDCERELRMDRLTNISL